MQKDLRRGIPAGAAFLKRQYKVGVDDTLIIKGKWFHQALKPFTLYAHCELALCISDSMYPVSVRRIPNT